MAKTCRWDLGRNLLCVAALGGLSLYWLAQAQNASTDADRFTGATRRLEAEGWRVSRRSFEASARSAWHRHSGGQLIFVESGRARVQDRGGKMLELKPGESHYTAQGIEHWHGAAPDGEFRQVALSRGDEAETVWLEKVSDQQYAGR
jgi:quercetin dioxygenase-like cupin family protein